MFYVLIRLRGNVKLSCAMKASPILVLTILFAFSETALAAGSEAAAVRQFEQAIRPVLASECLKCHGEKKQKGGLRLDSRAAILRGGDSGPALVLGDPAASLVLSALRYEDLEMPPENPLAESIIQEFETWISNEAPWPSDLGAIRPSDEKITASDREWWAFQPVRKPMLPRGIALHGARNPIDRFVQKRLNDDSMNPAPPADDSVLLRRVYFDLLGLPPSSQKAKEFLEDGAPDRWERLVDQLLADPRYGEHWARYWLDIVRFSDSDGWNQDAFRPNIWRYRDYVINSFNRDKPYSEFVREQLAGDEMPGDNPDAITATGFLRLGIYEYNQRDARGHWNDIMNEMTDVAGDVFLGMSMACARCHDHKFDPVIQKDYFKLRSFFEPLTWRDDLKAATEKEHETYAQQHAVWETATVEVRARLDAFLKPYHDKKWDFTVDKFPLDIQDCFKKPIEERTSLEHQMAYLVSRQFLEEGGGPLKNITKEDKVIHESLKKELAEYDHLKPKPLPSVMSATDFEGTLSPTLIPDDPKSEAIAPGFLTVLSGNAPEGLDFPETNRGSGRRTALARWIGQDDNPLTPRVIVNRVWQQHFGQGLVATPNDFGHNGERPTHPELLDWLTATFIDSGWSLKSLHRVILTSSTWMQSSEHPSADQYQQLDPSETKLWRYRVHRLKAEQIRDAMLTVSGELSNRIGGPSNDEKHPGRALYMKQFRNRNDTFLHAFDLSGGLKSVAVRNTTTTPTQSLIMINGDYVLARATKMAAELLQDGNLDAASIVSDAIQRCWGRQPSEEELENSIEFLVGSELQTTVKPARLVDLCHVLFNSNEFLYLD
jgi:cytochrome c553